MENYSEGLATGMALTQGNGYNNGGFGFGNNSWGELIGLIVVAGLFGFGNFGGGYGGRGGACATQADVRAAVDQQTLISKLDQQTYGLADSTYALNNTINGNFRTLDNAICTLGYQNQAGINSISHQISDCCCQTQRAIDSVNYNMAKNTCDIIRAGQDNTRAILDYLTSDKIDTLNRKLAVAENEALTYKNNAYLISQIKEPCPIPAYITPNPNCCYNYNIQGVGYGSVGYGNGCNAL